MYVRERTWRAPERKASEQGGKEKEEAQTIGSTVISSINVDGVNVGTPESYRNCRCGTTRRCIGIRALPTASPNREQGGGKQ